jgi:hypothetical protein
LTHILISNIKVYDVTIPGEDGVTSVVRVARPDFPVEKLKSEVRLTLISLLTIDEGRSRHFSTSLLSLQSRYQKC